MNRPEIPAQTLQKQQTASDPARSAWVSANAGSGKTHVLTTRIIRLLLNGVAPEKILCLTYTKVAAAHMATGIFNRLAHWTQIDDTALAQDIIKLGETRPDAAQLRRARCLFAEAVETPGGLKIQTIHAFCERLLHLFPFEANVSASFSVIEEEEQTLLLKKAQDHVLTHVESPELRAAIALLADETSEDGLNGLMMQALRRRSVFEGLLRNAYPISELAKDMRIALNLAPDDQSQQLKQQVLEHGPSAKELLAWAKDLASSAFGKRLAIWISAAPEDKYAAYLRLFYKADGDVFDELLPQKQTKTFPDIAVRLAAESARVVELLDKIRAATLVERTLALVSVVDAILSRYKGLNARLSKLDFDDLITRTQHLLERPGSEWVLFKLDQGIDHILVDEAQDTSPPQWKVFSALAEEFFAGAGQKAIARSFFAVGDEKQSIYSFQGAAPHLFAENRNRFENRLQAAGSAFSAVRLDLSFRSSRTVLKAVDDVFAVANNAKGLSFDTETQLPTHEALHRDLPGLVEIWPLPVKADDAAPQDWQLPLDLMAAEDPKRQLAEQIASTIAGWLDSKSQDIVTDKGSGQPRKIRAGDILILVRSRNTFVSTLNRALKQHNVPVAGSDRLKLKDHIAVMDLIAAGRAALLDLDDYHMACVLKSPLFGFDDDDLLVLAPRRAGRLIAELEQSDIEKHRLAATRIRRWQVQARQMPPFGFYMLILGEERGRQKLLARLGPEAADVIDEFLSAALTHEAQGAPSLVQFLAEMEASERPIKRDLDQAGDCVRVMTVHAAKGLEAKIVFLPDSGSVPDGSKDAKFYLLPRKNSIEGTPPLLFWSPRKDEDCRVVAAARQQALDLAHEEHRRLLYVAMTRAEERIYIAGSHSPAAPDAAPKAGQNWYEMVHGALAGKMQAIPAPWDAEKQILRRTDGKTQGLATTPGVPETSVMLPHWLTRPVMAEAPPAQPLHPSQSGAPTDGAAPLRGQLIHKLLQYLPDLPLEQRQIAARAFLARNARTLAEPAREALISEVLALIIHPDLAALFGPSSRAEVSICGKIIAKTGEEYPVSGRIDRLLVEQSEVLLIDFKSGTRHAGYIGQMALYRALLQQIYPGHVVKAVLIWTDGPRIEPLAPAALDAALAMIKAV